MKANDVRVSAAGIAVAVELLLKVPEQLEGVRAEIAKVREELVALRRLVPPPLFSVAEAASRLDMSRRTIRRHIAQGNLPSIKIGTAIRIDLSSILAALEQSTVRR